MYKLSIKNWAVEDRPREKLANKGRDALSDAELLAIIMGSGNARQSAVELARQILSEHDNSLNKLARLSVSELMQYPGIGEAKAIAITAAMEIGRRRKDVLGEEKPMIGTSTDAFNLLHHRFLDLPYESFVVMLLDRANHVLHTHEMSRGGITGTIIDPRLVFKTAFEKGACGFICAHNHPSGNLSPSSSDKLITKQLKEAGEILQIKLLDHLIVCNAGYFSFADQGIL